MTGIEQAGAVVGDGQLLNALDRLGILDGDGGVVAERLQEVKLGFAKAVHVDVHQLDNAQHPVLGAHRDADDGVGLPLGHLVDALGEARIAHDVGDDQAFAVFGDPSGDAFAYFKSHILKGFCGISDGDGEIELVSFFVHHQQGPVVGAEVFRHLFHDGLQNGIEIERRGKGLGHTMEDFEFLNLPVAGRAGGLTHENGSFKWPEVLKLYVARASHSNQPW